MQTSVTLRLPRAHRRYGSAMVFLAFLLPVILMVAAYTINVVYMELVRTELQVGTDIATRAAGRTLALTGDKRLAIADAKRLAAANTVCKIPLTLDESDIMFGASIRSSDTDRYDFLEHANANAVQLRTESFAKNMVDGIPLAFPSMGVPIKFRPLKTAICTQAELDVALVLDRSTSMAYPANESSGSNHLEPAPAFWLPGTPVPPNTRWLDVVASVHAFLDVAEESIQDERISLITYGPLPSTDVRLTSDYADVRHEMFRRSSRFVGGTSNVGAGIMEGINALGHKGTARHWASRVMIVFSDGKHNSGYDPLAAARTAANQKVTIYTVSFSDEANQTQMKQIADIGSGAHFHATTGSELSTAFREIARSLPTLLTH